MQFLKLSTTRLRLSNLIALVDVPLEAVDDVDYPGSLYAEKASAPRRNAIPGHPRQSQAH